MERKFLRELRAAGLAGAGAPGPVVEERELDPLPEPARRFLRFAGVVGRPRDGALRAHFQARFRPRRGGPWLPAEVWQLNAAPEIARVFHMRLRMFGVPVYGRDLYVRGRGRMLVRPLDLFTLEDARGPEFDQGELVTWLNDAVLLAPSMLLSPRVTFSAADASSFGLALADGGATVRARVLVDASGAAVDFETQDRFYAPTRARTRWTTPIDGWREVDGRRIATGGRAVWHFPDGEYAYVEARFAPGDVVFGRAG